jgi:hypothetical protein
MFVIIFSCAFFLQIKNMHKHAYMRTNVHHSNNFDLCKIQAMQSLPEPDVCVHIFSCNVHVITPIPVTRRTVILY